MTFFTEKDIQIECDSGSFRRGYQYFQSARVTQVEIEDTGHDFVRIIGEVTGSYPYTQNIVVYRSEHYLDISGDCSCPVSFNCKHVVAVLLNYLDKQKTRKIKNISKSASESQKIDQWFNELANLSKVRSENDIPDSAKWLAYVFEYDERFGTIEINFARTGIKKRGGYNKPQTLRFSTVYESIHGYHLPAYIYPIDKLIIGLLGSQRDRYFSYAPIRLEGTTGAHVLEKILSTKRCFWNEITENCLISSCNGKKLNYQWQSISKAKNSARQLKGGLGNDIKLIKTEPPHYIDIRNKNIGLLQTSLTASHIELFENMPPVPNKMLEGVSMKLIADEMEAELPLPTPIEISYIGGEQLTPKITLTSIGLDDTEHYISRPNRISNFHGIRISWLYGDIEIQPLEETSNIVKKDSRYLKIVRDEAQEKLLLEMLLVLDFEPISVNLETGQYSDDCLLIPSLKKSMQQQLLQWKRFFEVDIPELVNQGWQVEFAKGFHLDFIQADDDWDVEVVEENDWFNLKFDLNLSSGKKLPLLPLVTPLLNDYSLNDIPEELLIESAPGQYISLSREKILPILKLLYELFDSLPISQDSMKISKFDALQIEHLNNHDEISINWFGSNKLKNLTEKLADFSGLKNIAPSKQFQGELRDYQQQGLNWLQFLRDFEFSGLLADDMGLGKTVQTLVHLQKEKMAKRLTEPCLIIAPTSLMSNWKKEASQFTPNLKVLILQGTDRHQYFAQIENHDLILTTYPLIVRDFKQLSQTSFYTIVLDEAQNIKNPKTKATKLIKCITTKHRLALTGTPMENHLGELWSVFDFLMPGFLGSETAFKRRYRTPIEKHGNTELSNMLAKRVQPFLLRRTKDLVAKELPAKTTIIKTAILGSAQSALYETIRIAMQKKIMQALAAKGLNRSHITILDALLKLRQVCCDPQLLKLEQAKKVKESAKLELLMSMLPELVEEGRKILIFSQFTSMLKIIQGQLQQNGIDYTQLTGSTINRDKVIEKFTSGEVPVFLISLKAGGVGLNLVEADTVIHYDPWWNPAVENQASDRAHRIGQNKPVFVYKLVVENTLEEKILEMQQRKQALADGIYGKEKNNATNALTAKDIEELLAQGSF